MRKVELRMNEEYKYKIIKKLVETNGNKQRAAIKLKRYLEQFKPREYRSIQNFIITKKVVMLYNEAISKLTNHENNDANLGVMHVKSIAGEEYKIHYSSHSTFKLGEMYLTSQYVIYIVKSSYEKYYENYIEKTKKYSKPDRRVWNIVEYMLPNVVEKSI